MRLYTDSNGRWAGTQSDAKQFGEYEQVDVPTDKPTLLEFLNEYQVGAADVISAQMEVIQQNTHPSSPRNSFSEIEQTRLKAAYEHAGLAREYLRRVYQKVGEDEE